ncbi:MAG TPA: GNAT family N-acetyltransferase [Dehalococcoidia bacterium]|jgi:ribosomal protein S18 acetylase RimI-like enzyme
MDRIDVRRLTPALLPDFLTFFDHDAFADNRDWAGCYCVFYHASDADWAFGGEGNDPATTALRVGRHREVAQELIGDGGMSGFLAYAGGKVAGWCNAGPRDLYQNPRTYGRARDNTPRVGAIMCFVVAQPFRRSGVASALVDGVVQAFAADGLDFVEAYPSLKPGGPTEAGGLYHGPMELYVRAGFERVRDEGGFAVMRKRLRPS